MKALRNVVRVCVVGLSVSALGAGCSDGGGAAPIGTLPTGGSSSNTTGGTPPAGTAGTGGSAATTAGTGGTGPSTGGQPTGGTTGTSGSTGTGGSTGGSTGTAGTGTGGSTGGTGGTTGGTGTGGTTGGTGGTGTAGTGGTGGGTALGFPAGCPAPTGTHSATALTRSCWNTNASDCAATNDNMNPAKQAIDDSTTTRFSTGVKQDVAGTHFTWEVDLGAATMIDGIVATSNATDFAPGLMVSVSTDGTTFTNVACATGVLATDVSFAAVSAKVVRLTQYGNSDKWWSLYDLNVYGTGTTCAGGAGTPTDACTNKHNQ